MFYRYYDQTEGRVSDMGPCFYSHQQILVQVPEELWRPRMNLIFGDGGSHPQKTVTPVQ